MKLRNRNRVGMILYIMNHGRRELRGYEELRPMSIIRCQRWSLLLAVSYSRRASRGEVVLSKLWRSCVLHPIFWRSCRYRHSTFLHFCGAWFQRTALFGWVEQYRPYGWSLWSRVVAFFVRVHPLSLEGLGWIYPSGRGLDQRVVSDIVRSHSSYSYKFFQDLPCIHKDRDSSLIPERIGMDSESSYWHDWSWSRHLRVVVWGFRGEIYRIREIHQERVLPYVRVISLLVVHLVLIRWSMLHSLYGGWYEMVAQWSWGYLSWGVLRQNISSRARSALLFP